LIYRFSLIKSDEAVSVFENNNTSVYGVKEVESLNGCKLSRRRIKINVKEMKNLITVQ